MIQSQLDEEKTQRRRDREEFEIEGKRAKEELQTLRNEIAFSQVILNQVKDRYRFRYK